MKSVKLNWKHEKLENRSLTLSETLRKLSLYWKCFSPTPKVSCLESPFASGFMLDICLTFFISYRKRSSEQHSRTTVSLKPISECISVCNQRRFIYWSLLTVTSLIMHRLYKNALRAELCHWSLPENGH